MNLKLTLAASVAVLLMALAGTANAATGPGTLFATTAATTADFGATVMLVADYDDEDYDDEDYDDEDWCDEDEWDCDFEDDDYEWEGEIEFEIEIEL